MQVPLASEKKSNSPAPVLFIDTATMYQGFVVGCRHTGRLFAQ
jgi:hypothetical protein